LPNLTARKYVSADGTDLEQVTEDQGQTTFDLAAGEYLVCELTAGGAAADRG